MKTAFIRMGRYGLRILLSVLALVAIIYLLLFTRLGNTLVKPLIETKLSALFQTPVTIDTLTLTHNTLVLNFHDALRNSVQIQGQFSLITLTLHAVYQADLSPISTMHLTTTGIINGGYNTMAIQGSADIFKGNIQYRTQLSRFHPSDLHVTLNRIDYQSLMTWLEYPHHSSTALTGEIDLHGLDRRDVHGDVTLLTHTQNFDPSKIIDDNSSFDFLSLFTDDQGNIQPFHLNVTLKTSIDELGILEQFAMLPLRGSANLTAALQGDQDRLVLDAHSNLAKSSSHARLHWKRLRPSYVYLDIQHADANALFHLFSLPSPIEGKVHLNAESTITHTTAQLSVQNGLTHPDILKRDYHLTQPQSCFTAEISAQAEPKTIHYQGKFKSDLGRMDIDNTTTHTQMLHDLLKSIP